MGATRGASGSQRPRLQITEGRRKVPTISQALSLIQYIYSQKTLGSNMGAPNLFLDPGAI